MAASTTRVKGYREFVRACNRAADRDTPRFVKGAFRAVGDIVKDDARQRFAPIDARSAAGFRTVVRVRGVTVEQRIPRTTGQHPQFGALQMRVALLPAVENKQREVEHEFERALDQVATHFDD